MIIGPGVDNRNKSNDCNVIGGNRYGPEEDDALGMVAGRLQRHKSGARAWCVVPVLFCLILGCYINSLNASWQYDDYGNIVHNTKVHASQWSWSQIKQSGSAGLESQIIGRPLAYLTFALNYKIGGLNVVGYHLFNLVVHLIASLFLYLFIRDSLNLPSLKERYAGQAVPIAVLATALWATHPIQVTAVTYIVQRMASMAGMFYIMVMYFFLKYRITGRTAYAVAAVIGGLCALLTKENTVMMVYAILLYDFLLLRGAGGLKSAKFIAWGAGLTLLLAMMGLLYTNFDLQQLVASYAIRPFTPVERLLTQPRVIFFYLGLLAMPMTSRMTLLHDIEISHNLWTPWSTAPAAAGVIICIAALGLFSRRSPLLAFSGLFFFLNHLIEGSFLNLEMIYEHRNYIPSMLIFLAPAIIAVKSFHYFRYRPSFQWMIAGGALLMLLSNSSVTIAYNRIFKTELSLWRHAVKRAPDLSLAHSNLGTAYWEQGVWDKARDEFFKAHSLDRYFNLFHKGVVLFNLGLYVSEQDGDYAQAAGHFLRAKSYYPQNNRIWYHLGIMQVAIGERIEALKTVSAAISRWPKKPELHYLSALIHLKGKSFTQAVQEADRALELNPDHGGALMVKAQCYKGKGEYGRAIEYWNGFMALEPKNLHGLIALIELYYQTKQFSAAQSYLDRFIRLQKDIPLDEVLATAVKTGAYGAYPVDAERITAIFKRLTAMK